MPRKNGKPARLEPPGWFRDLIATPFKAGLGSEFIVYGDINCLVPNDDTETPYISLRQFWEKIFGGREMVIFYNIASGAEFLTSDMEREFKKIVGTGGEDGGSGDPIAAARAGLAAKKGIPREPEACLALIEKALKNKDGVAVIVNSAHFIAPSANGGGWLQQNERVNVERFKNWARDEEIKEKGNIIILLTEQSSKISDELRESGSGVRLAMIPKPSKDERRSFILSMAKNGMKKSSGFNPDAITVATQGMGLQQIFEIFLRAKNAGAGVDLEYVKERKKEILDSEFGDVMEVVEPIMGLDDIGGLDHIKAYLRRILGWIKAGNVLLVPMGITLMGPPGTGKTAIVEAFAREAGFNFVKMKNVRAMYVGVSESRKEKQLYGIRAMAPVVVMNDEADLAEANRDAPKGDSGVSEKLMQMWMEFLSDPRIQGQVLVMSCTNRPDRLDPAMKRSGRSDERILLPMPSFQERLAIFQVMVKYYKILTDIKDFTSYAELTEGLSGADIRKILQDGSRIAATEGAPKVDGKHIKAAVEDFIPSASQAEIDYMTLLGISESSSRSLLPLDVKKRVLEIEKRGIAPICGELISAIRARNIV